MHEAKVNTFSVELPLTSKNIATQDAVPAYVGAIDVPFGRLRIQRRDATGHAIMRTRQISNLLPLIQAEGAAPVDNLAVGSSGSLLGLAWQSANEVESVNSILVGDVAESKA